MTKFKAFSESIRPGDIITHEENIEALYIPMNKKWIKKADKKVYNLQTEEQLDDEVGLYVVVGSSTIQNYQ